MNVDDTTPVPPPSLTDRVWSLRTVAAAAITAVALSGAGGAALAAASNGGTSGGPGGRGGFGGPPGQMGGRFGGLVPGQVQGKPGRQNGQTQSSAGLTRLVLGQSETGRLPGGHRPRTRGVPGQLPPATTRDTQDT